MKTYQIILILAFLCYLPQWGFSQGYAGKRTTLGYYFNVGTGIQETIGRNGGTYNRLALLASHHVELGYAFSRTGEIGFCGFGYKSTYQIYDLTMRGFGAYYKYFLPKKGAIAPVGSWYQIKYMHNVGQAQNPDFERDQFSVDYGQLRVGAGRQVLIFKHVLFRVGVEFAIPAHWFQLEFGRYGFLELRDGYALNAGFVIPLF